MHIHNHSEQTLVHVPVPSLLSQPAISPTDREVTNHLDSFPPQARGRLGFKGQSKHMSELLPQQSLIVLVSVFCLVEDVGGIRQVVECVGFPKKVYALCPEPEVCGEMFKMHMSWARLIGKASQVLIASHELTVLLGIDAGHHRARNGILIVQNGKIVWSQMAPAQRPQTPHTLDAFAEAFANLRE